MSKTAWSGSKALQRLGCREPTLKMICLHWKNLTDAELGELADCLLTHPDVVTHVYLARNRLTDETGVKLARYVAASSTIKRLSLCNNQLGEATYLALAAALRVNTSLQVLYLFGNQAVNRTHIDTAFFEALRLNPDRPVTSRWMLHTNDGCGDIDFKRLKNAADELGHPTLQMILNHELENNEIKTVKHIL